MKIRQNKYFIFEIIIMTAIIVFSFISYYRQNFSYSQDYNNIKKHCYNNKESENPICGPFIINGKIDISSLEKYLEDSNPITKRKTMDAITVTSEIVELTNFNQLQLFSPLLIAFVVIGMLSSEFTSGNFKNYLLRENYNEYLKKTYKSVIKVAFIMPMSLIVIFIISCFFTRFNFDYSNVSRSLAVYNEWKYNNFIVYGISVCIIQFLISLLYINIAIFCIYRNKSKIVTVIMSYLVFILVYIFIYIVVYIFIINRVLGFKELTDYFNIIGYWFFDNGPNFISIIPLAFLFYLISFLVVRKIYKNKESMVLAYEKQNS